MLLAIGLLYVGAVLCINGIWLIGQARAAEARTAPESAAGVAAGERLAEPGGRHDVAAVEGEQARTSASVGGRGQEPALARAEASPLFIQNREITVINLFTGGLLVILAVTQIVYAAANSDLASARGAGFVLLFGFTYLWVMLNQFLNAGGRGFGWYCLFVAITAVPAGIYTLSNTGGHAGSVWLGLNWFAWAILWFLFFVLLALDRPIGKLAGAVAVLEGIATCWVLGFLVLIEKITF